MSCCKYLQSENANLAVMFSLLILLKVTGGPYCCQQRPETVCHCLAAILNLADAYTQDRSS